MRIVTGILLFLALCLSAAAQSTDSSLSAGNKKRFAVKRPGSRGYSYRPVDLSPFQKEQSAQHGDSSKFNRFAIRIHGSADYCYRILSGQTGKMYSNLYDFRQEHESPAMGYTAGIGFSCFLKKQFAIQLGFNFSGKRFATDHYHRETLLPGETGTYTASYAFYNYKYIEIPLEGKVLLGRKKVRFIASAGLMADYLWGMKTVTGTRSFTPYEYERGDYSSINLFVTAGAGAEVKFGKVGIQLEPVFRYGLLSTNNVSIAEYLWQTGLDLGVSYSF